MSLMDQVQQDMYAAMKAGDQVKTGTLRTLLSKLKDRKIDNRGDLNDPDSIKVIQTLVKQRRESADVFERLVQDAEKRGTPINELVFGRASCLLPGYYGSDRLSPRPDRGTGSPHWFDPCYFDIYPAQRFSF